MDRSQSPANIHTENAARTAASFCARGDFVQAEFVCRNILDIAPHDERALNLIGVIAGQLGLRDAAIHYFTEVLRLAPHFTAARDNLTQAIAMAPPPPSRGQRFLLIKAWGAGFWSDVSSVLGALLVAEITKRIPVINWGNNSLFSDHPDRDAFGFYFEPVSTWTIDALKSDPNADYFPAKWSGANLGTDRVAKYLGPGSKMGGLYYLNRPETIAVADYYIGMIDLLPWIPRDHPFFGKTIDELSHCLIEKYLKPQAGIIAEVDRFYHRHIAGHPTIAVHVRGSDKISEIGGLDYLNRRYFESLDTAPPEFQFFLLTDDARWAKVFRERYGNRVVMTDCQRTDNNQGVHGRHNTGRVRLGTEIMVDTYLALRCDRFLGNGISNVSAMTTILKRWPEGGCTLVAPSLLHQRNAFIYGPNFNFGPDSAG